MLGTFLGISRPQESLSCYGMVTMVGEGSFLYELFAAGKEQAISRALLDAQRAVAFVNLRIVHSSRYSVCRFCP